MWHVQTLLYNLYYVYLTENSINVVPFVSKNMGIKNRSSSANCMHYYGFCLSIHPDDEFRSFVENVGCI